MTSRTARWAESAPVFGLLAFTVVFLVTGYQYSPQARAFPVAVAWVTLGLIALDLVSRQESRFGRAVSARLNPGGAPVQDAHGHGQQVTAVLWLTGFVALAGLIGIVPAVLIHVFASVRFRAGRSSLRSVAVAAGVTLVIWLLFAVFLRIELYRGLWFGGAEP